MKEVKQIIMGNDEFILYIRKKKNNCPLTNDQLGKMIWVWLRERKANIIIEDQPSMWEKTGSNINDLGLPKTAAQFSFDRDLLPSLYDYLDTI